MSRSDKQIDAPLEIFEGVAERLAVADSGFAGLTDDFARRLAVRVAALFEVRYVPKDGHVLKLYEFRAEGWDA